MHEKRYVRSICCKTNKLEFLAFKRYVCLQYIWSQLNKPVPVYDGYWAISKAIDRLQSFDGDFKFIDNSFKLLLCFARNL